MWRSIFASRGRANRSTREFEHSQGWIEGRSGFIVCLSESGVNTRLNRFGKGPVMRRNRRGGGFHQEFGGSGEDSFVAVVVTKLTGALLFILLLTMVIMALIPKADQMAATPKDEKEAPARLTLEVPEVLPEAICGRRYQYAFSVRSDSDAPLDWSLRDPLPAGLTFDAKSGRLSGSVEDSDLESIAMVIQVTDGKTVAGAVTTLPIWNPEKESDSNLPSSPARLVGDQQFEAWLSQGFGLALIWFGHIAGMGVVGRMQVQDLSVADERSSLSRFGVYRMSIRVVSVGLTAFLIYWMISRGG